MDSVTIDHNFGDRRSAGGSSDWIANHPDAGTSRLSRLAVVGTYPPTQCGIGSFTASLHRSLSAATIDKPPHVVRVQEGEPVGDLRPEVVEELTPDNPKSIETAARTLSAYGTVILQHEFGIYGSDHGKAVVDLVDQVTAPLILTLHTVTESPLHVHRGIVRELGSRADRLVVMSHTAARLFSTTTTSTLRRSS